MVRNNGQHFQDLENGYVSIGKIVKAHGIHGEIKVLPYSRSPENFKLYRKVILRDTESRRILPISIVRARSQGDQVVLQLAGVLDRNAAEEIAGMEVWLKKTDLPTLEPNEFYLHDLIGRKVVTDTGLEIGTAKTFLTTKAHDVLVVKGKGVEYLIPVNNEIILRLDEHERTVVISPPPGLLEIND